MDYFKKFNIETNSNISKMSKDKHLKKLSNQWVEAVTPYKWAYNFKYLGVPAIQFPNDIWGIQEIIWSVKPDLIIETGIAHGGSLIFSSSMLNLIDLSEAIEKNIKIDPLNSKRKVIGIDIDIREHNKNAIKNHPFSNKIKLIEGSSISNDVFKKVKEIVSRYKTILVILDSNHSHEHVYKELNFYAHLVTKNSYCIVLDTLIEDMPDEFFKDRPWGKGNNPKTAVYDFLKTNTCFKIDDLVCSKLQITVAPHGFLKRIE